MDEVPKKIAEMGFKAYKYTDFESFEKRISQAHLAADDIYEELDVETTEAGTE